MTTEHRTPEEIEREIERNREGLTDTLEDLQDKFSVETMARQFTDHLRNNGGDIGRSVSRSVKENPMAVALTGIGLAWMIFGGNTNSDDRDRYRRDQRYRNDDWDRGDVRPRHIRSNDTQIKERQEILGNEPSWARQTRDQDYDRHHSDPYALTESNSGTDSKTEGSLGDQMKDTVKSTADDVTSTFQSVRDSAGQSANDISQKTADLRERLSEGTEDFSAQARERIVNARMRAINARNTAARQVRQGRESAVDIFDEQPLVGGAVALAVGAAVAAALPRSQMEDDYFGEQSDAAMAEAEQIFKEEKEKLGKVAQAVSAETKQAVKDAKNKADDEAPDEGVAKTVKKQAKQSGKRIADAAKSEADKQDLGKAKS